MTTINRMLAFLLASLLPPLASFAQTDESPASVSANLKVAYTATLIYPGLRVGIELPVKRTQLNKTRRSGAIKSVFKERFLAVSLGGYHHPDFHDNGYATVEWVARRTRSGGFFTEFSPGAGYSRTFLGGTTYQVDAAGQVTTKPLAGYSYALVTVGLGLGYDFSRIHHRSVAVFAKANALVMFPYNNFLYARPTLEIGVIYKPKQFLSRSILTKRKQK